ncbi:VOC family protein [uncultured Croceicoccus sp.]|uniref:VOC family protein n=1 Tax=uncultured Croceicoccus sp. TaxID=1295329 RepID=UPI002624007B|nr:VOC family protein [uncultured Croceicoccus sp.]
MPSTPHGFIKSAIWKNLPMPILAIDHVNIRTPDMDGTIAFFRDMLDMEITAAPGRRVEHNARLLDEAGRAVVHLLREKPGAPVGEDNGAFDHVALECSGYDALLERLGRNGYRVRTNEVAEIGLRQIFVHEPNGVLLELNFRGD